MVIIPWRRIKQRKALDVRIRGGTILHKVGRKGISKHLSLLLSRLCALIVCPFLSFLLFVFSVNTPVQLKGLELFNDLPTIAALKWFQCEFSGMLEQMNDM